MGGSKTLKKMEGSNVICQKGQRYMIRKSKAIIAFNRMDFMRDS